MSNASAGFRLRAVELRNWGTFHGDQHYVVELGCASACVTGLNGSGKSTVVDALLTLLVPHEFRHYNVAATGSGAKRERSLKTYILGAYGKEESPDSASGQSKFLRKSGAISVLLAVFHDAVFGKSVTLAQLHWITASGDHQGRYLCREGAFRIGDLGIANLGVGAFAAHFGKNGWSHETSFEPYQGKFMGLLRIPSNQALKLFCRTVSVKDVPSVTEFIRSLMLEPYPTAKALDDIEKHFSDLDRIHTQLEETKAEIKLLEPVARHYAVYKAAMDEQTRLTMLHRAADVMLAREAGAAIDLEVAQLTQRRETLEADAERLARDLAEIDSRIVDIKVSMKQNSAFLTIDALKQQEERLAAELAKARALRKDLGEWLRLLGRAGLAVEEGSFAELKAWALKELEESTSRRDEGLKKSGAKSAEAGAVRIEAGKIADEIQDLQGRKDKIPGVFRGMRKTICDDLGLPEAALPFAGELLDVPDSEREWRRSLEFLLHGFALSVLVPEEHYRRFSGYVERSEFRKRLVYFQVPKGTGLTATLEASRAYGKIAIKPDAWCRGWLQQRLVSDFSHRCANTMEEFWQETGPALTKNRHVKSGARSVKEGTDSDRDLDILGWSNEGKIAELQRQLGVLQQKARQLDSEAQKLEADAKGMRSGIALLSNIAAIQTYRAVDEAGISAELVVTTERRRELEASDETWKQLNASLTEAQQEKDSVGKQRDGVLGEFATRGSEIKVWNEKRGAYSAKVNAAAVDDFDWKSHEEAVREFRDDTQMSLKGLERHVANVLGRISAATQKQKMAAGEAHEVLLPAMTRFLEATKAKGHRLDWGPTAASAPALVAHLGVLTKDNFHTQQQEFSTMMRKVLLDDLRVGDGDLQVQCRNNKVRIDELNITLRDVPYNEGTFVRIVTRASRDNAVLTYREKLENCTRHSIGMTDEQLNERFAAVKALVDHIRSKRNEAEKGANPNNWEIFAIEEVRAEEPQTVANWFTDADGNSGGQKAKLACTILAAAMAFQLKHTRSRQSNAFRLVMVDEIFSKSDDVNSAFALSIFEKFDFQLLLVTPRDGRLKLVQPYVGSFHLVQNPNTMASMITSMTSVEVEKATAEPTHDDADA